MNRRQLFFSHQMESAGGVTSFPCGSISRAASTAVLAAVLLLAVAATPWAQAQYEVLYRFDGKAGGAVPYAGVIRDAAGNLYGTTQQGGDHHCYLPLKSEGCGVVFKLSPAGEETVLYTFTGAADGTGPTGGVISDPAGNLYGTTGFGGDHSCFPPFGCGVVFKLDTTGKETVLHPFTDGADGFVPQAGVIQDEAGNLYGTTPDGSIDDGGAVFKLSATTQKLTVLHTFTFGGTDGSSPNAGVIRDEAGNLYGTATAGGDLNCNPNSMPAGCGVVFKLSPTGEETVLYTFTGGADGAFPSAGLIRDTAGNLYGTTGGGGEPICFIPGGCGVVFKLSPAGRRRCCTPSPGERTEPNPPQA